MLDVPYPKILFTHGFVLGEGRTKLSKSAANTGDPIANYGGDVIRLWTCTSNPYNDIIISPPVLRKVRKDYRSIRTSLWFVIANLYDFNYEKVKIWNFVRFLFLS